MPLYLPQQTLSSLGGQIADSDLDAIAALPTQPWGRDWLTLASDSAARTALSLVPGTNVQAYDSDLDAIAALTTTGLIDRTGAGTATTRATGATGLSVLEAADAATARASLGISDLVEGTWAVAYSFSTSGSCTMHPTSFGRYRLDGDWVEFWLRAVTSALSSAEGEVRINLPFSASTANQWPVAVSLAYNWGSSVSKPISALINLADFIRLYSQIPSDPALAIQGSDLNSGTIHNHVFISGKYKRA